MDEPRTDLFRGLLEAPELRAAHPDPADDGPDSETDPADQQIDAEESLMRGHFAVFDVWTEIDSWFEGQFLERLAPGCFKKTFRENRAQMKVQFDHGYDDFVGGALLGPIDDLREDDIGGYYEVPLLDTDYNRDRVLPLLQGRLMTGEKRGSLLGASFRFNVLQEEWSREPKASAHNPLALPERTIKEVRCLEFGPVVWPAYPEATAGTVPVRSLTDHYHEVRLRRSGQALRAAHRLAPAAPAGTGVAEPSITPDEPARSHSEVTSAARTLPLWAAQTAIRGRRTAS